MLLVEGPSDMLAARSAGLPAIAVPGANAWRSEWASALDGHRVVVVMDCDRPGRQAAARIAEDLERRGIVAGIRDLAPRRQDGYDVSDWLREGKTAAPAAGDARVALGERVPADGRRGGRGGGCAGSAASPARERQAPSVRWRRG